MHSAARRRRDRLSPGDRVALYGQALAAWRASVAQRGMGCGATREQAERSVREDHERSLRGGYAADVRAERDAFVDRYVDAAVRGPEGRAPRTRAGSRAEPRDVRTRPTL